MVQIDGIDTQGRSITHSDASAQPLLHIIYFQNEPSARIVSGIHVYHKAYAWNAFVKTNILRIAAGFIFTDWLLYSKLKELCFCLWPIKVNRNKNKNIENISPHRRKSASLAVYR